MNKAIIFVGVLALAMLARAADAPAPVTYPVTYMDASRVTEALAKTGLITSNAEYMVAGAHRESPARSNCMKRPPTFCSSSKAKRST